LKYDGFRAVAVIENGRAELFSRDGHSLCVMATLARNFLLHPKKTRKKG
jgi:hypothetical protein